MFFYKRESSSPKKEYYQLYSKKEFMKYHKIIKFYRILFGLQIIIIILVYYIYAFSVSFKNIVK